MGFYKVAKKLCLSCEATKKHLILPSYAFLSQNDQLSEYSYHSSDWVKPRFWGEGIPSILAQPIPEAPLRFRWMRVKIACKIASVIKGMIGHPKKPSESMDPYGVYLPETNNTNSKFAPENGWLEYDRFFPFGAKGLFSGAFAVSFRECKVAWWVSSISSESGEKNRT